METPKRHRVSKACVVCRQKKIKCDGQVPCKHCANSNRPCEYPAKTGRGLRVGKRSSNLESMRLLDTRLARLELLISNLTSKLELPAGGSILPDLNVAVSDDEIKKEEDEEDDDTSESNSASKDGDEYVQSFGVVESNNVVQESFQTSSFSIEQCYGVHSAFHIFSDKSMDYIRQRVGTDDPDITMPMENLPIFINICKRSHNFLWQEPHVMFDRTNHRQRDGIYIHNKPLITELLGLFGQIYLASFLCDEKEIQALLENLYFAKTSSPETPRHKYSDLLAINASLVLCITTVVNSRIESDRVRVLETPAIRATSTEDLIKLQDTVFINSIYYYGRVCVISEGIRTIQAILLLVIFLETTLVSSHINYVLASNAVRFAQEMGLHRCESFAHLSEEEQAFRRRIWWFCQYFDMEVCYRYGKPPIVNDNDVTTLTEKDRGYGVGDPCVGLTPNDMTKIVKDRLFHIYSGNYLLKLTQIRSKSYKELFTAGVSYDSYASIATTVNRINNEMEKLAESMDPRVRPLFHSDPNFSAHVQQFMSTFLHPTMVYNVITFQMAYFLHLMSVNRLPSQISLDLLTKAHNDGLHFRHVSSESARTLLKLAIELDHHKYPTSLVDWDIIFPMAAYLNLIANCVNYPHHPEALNDLQLLRRFCIKAHGSLSLFLDTSNSRIFYQRVCLCDLILRITLRLAIKVLETEIGVQVLEKDPELRVLLTSMRSEYPDIYLGFRQSVASRMEEYQRGKLVSSMLHSSLLSGTAGSQFKFGATGYVIIGTNLPGLTPEDRRMPSISNLLRTESKPPPPANPNTFSDIMEFAKFLDTDDSYWQQNSPGLGELPNYFFDNGL